jgi:hypothetical protein
MATTRTSGITVLADSRRFIDKRYLGVRIGLRVGAVTQEQAEERLQIEIARVQCELARKAHARPTLTDCAARYVAQSRAKRSIDVKWHVTLLQSYLGDLEPQQVHDQTLEPFVKARLAAGASATTINRSLEVVRTILNRAARSYRDTDGRPWLEAMPPLITMLPESPRSPYPITWKEQDTLFRKLPKDGAHHRHNRNNNRKHDHPFHRQRPRPLFKVMPSSLHRRIAGVRERCTDCVAIRRKSPR